MAECLGCGSILVGRQTKWCSAKCQKQEARRQWVLKTYGITLEEYSVILHFQGDRCAICRKSPRADENLHIDHEHGGYVRGLVCAFCNRRVIGRLKSADLARRFADYLTDPPAIKALGKSIIAPGRPKRKRQPRKKPRG